MGKRKQDVKREAEGGRREEREMKERIKWERRNKKSIRKGKEGERKKD